MERELDYNNSHYVTSRLSLWCPVCGASEGKGCNVRKHEGLRFSAHNAVATNSAPRPTTIPIASVGMMPHAAARKEIVAKQKGWTPKNWVQ